MLVLGAGAAAGQTGGVAQRTGGRVVGGVEVGFDSFQEKYSIVDNDTLDSVNEFRSRARLGYARGTLLGNYFLVEVRGLLGESDYETGGRLRWTRRMPRITSTFQIDTDVTKRGFHGKSSYQFPNDQIRASVRAFFRKAIGRSVSVRLYDYLEDVNFDQRTLFDYDYLRNSVTLSADFEAGLTTAVSAGVRNTVMSVPDSSQIEYVVWQPLMELNWVPELRRRLVLLGSLERRNYGDDATRSSFWALLATGGVEWPLHELWSIEFLDDVEHFDYDTDSDAYYSYTENRAAVLINYNASWYFQAGAGPTYATLRSRTSAQDEYDEFGARFAVEYTRGASLWMSATYEPGWRDYLSYDGNDELADAFASVFSDYAYHRVSFFANVRVWNGLSLSVLADYQPEDHDRQSDDATATLFSVGLSYVF